MINTGIYGTPEQWVNPFSTQEHTDRKLMFLQAYFGGGGVKLQDGYGYGIELNTPIDKSLSWCGLGTESVWSHLEYHRRYTDFPLIAADDRAITNFSWNSSRGNNMYNIWLYNKGTSLLYGSRQRFSPRAVNTSGDVNRNNEIEPYSQIPVKNCVLVPFFTVAETIPTTATTTGMNIHQVPAWEYYSDTATVNHNTHPYILYIQFTPYSYSKAVSTVRTRIPSGNSQSFSILDPISLQKGLPYDINDEGSPVMGDVYAYNIFTAPSNYFGFMIFGHINNAYNDSVYCSYDTELSTAHNGTIIVPHPNAVYSNEIDISSTSKAKWYYLQYYDGLKEWVRRQIACFGLFFTDDTDTAETGEYDDDNMLLGVLVDGVGHGDYTHGEDNRLQPQWDWDTTNDSDYDPSNPPEIDPNIYGVDSSFNSVSLADGALKRYVLDDSGMELLNKYLWDIINTTNPDELIANQTLTNFLTNNPLDCIVGIKRFPFADMSQGSTTNIRLGKVTVPNTAAKPFHSDTTTLSCGWKFIPHYFDDWRSYACQFTVVLPFCGTVSLPPEIVVGHWIEIKYSIDYTTGTCTAWIICELDDGSNVVIDSACGNCCIDIPVSGVQTATLTGEIYNANENLKLTKFNQAIGYAKSGIATAESAANVKLNPMGLFNNTLNLGQDIANNVISNKNTEWNINNTEIPLKMIGASSGCNSFQHELVPRLIVYKPVTDNAPNYNLNFGTYAHSVGYQCCETAPLSNYSGYAECTNVDLSGFNATATEKNMIQAALAGGVYL